LQEILAQASNRKNAAAPTRSLDTANRL